MKPICGEKADITWGEWMFNGIFWKLDIITIIPPVPSDKPRNLIEHRYYDIAVLCPNNDNFTSLYKTFDFKKNKMICDGISIEDILTKADITLFQNNTKYTTSDAVLHEFTYAGNLYRFDSDMSMETSLCLPLLKMVAEYNYLFFQCEKLGIGII